MLGKSIRSLTETFAPRSQRRGQRIFLPAQAQPGIMRKMTPQIDFDNPEQLAAYLETEIALAEAMQEQQKVQAVKMHVETPPVTDWIEARCVNPDTVNMVTRNFSRATGIKLAPHQRRILTKVLTLDPGTGLFPYRTIVYSAPKKSGKTSISAFAAAWVARWIESPNAIMVFGNKKDQAAERALAFMAPSLMLDGARLVGDRIELDNGTVIQALANEASNEAGGTYGMTVWTELWGFTTARDRKLWAEMMPVNTRKNSIRWVETYAGYEDSSDLLLALFLSIFTDISERKLQEKAEPVPGLEDITTTDADGTVIPACYHRPDLGLFYYNDHEHRMEWQTGAQSESYYNEVAVGLTETDIIRLVHNRWQATQNRFVSVEDAAASFDRGKDLPLARPGVFAIDASKTSAGTALVGMYEDSYLDRYRMAYGKVWYPDPIKKEIDLEETVIAEVVRLWGLGLILRRKPVDKREQDLVDKEGVVPIELHYDGYQMAQVALNLRKTHKLLPREFSQQTDRLIADTFLRAAYENNKVDNINTQDIRDHLDAAKAKIEPDKSGDTTRVRIVRGEGVHAKPNDMIVAQSMATIKLSQRPRVPVGLGLGQGVATGWNP